MKEIIDYATVSLKLRGHDIETIDKKNLCSGMKTGLLIQSGCDPTVGAGPVLPYCRSNRRRPPNQCTTTTTADDA
jgi:hypothetical protein